MKNPIRILIISVGIIAILSVALFFWLVQSENNTFIRDEYNGQILIEHFDTDTNDLRLELRENGQSRWIKHPICCVEYKGHIPDNKVLFDRKNQNMLIVNGQQFLIEDE